MANKEKEKTPRIEHVNLVVTGIDPTARFLMAAFPHWRVRGQGGGEWAGVPRRWAHIGDDDNYVTLNEFKLPKARRAGVIATCKAQSQVLRILPLRSPISTPSSRGFMQQASSPITKVKSIRTGAISIMSTRKAWSSNSSSISATFPPKKIFINRRPR